MAERPGQEIYSPHRYLNNEDGTPDYEKIFSVIESPLRRHIDTWLLEHLENQPEIVREFKHLKNHLRDCPDCMEKTETEIEKEQIDLPPDPE